MGETQYIPTGGNSHRIYKYTFTQIQMTQTFYNIFRSPLKRWKSIYNRRSGVCLWFRHKILRIGPKSLCGARRAPMPAKGWHPSICRPFNFERTHLNRQIKMSTFYIVAHCTKGCECKQNYIYKYIYFLILDHIRASLLRTLGARRH